MQLIKAFLLLLFLVPLPIYGQGFFFSEFYSDKEHDFHHQIWDLEQDSNQFIHFGTGGGALRFNGLNFKEQHIGESGRGTSLLVSSSGKLYASGQYDFGIVKSDSINGLYYSSISNNYYSVDDLVNVHFKTIESDSKIYFIGWDGIEIFENDSLKKYPQDNISFPNAFLFNERIFVSNRIGLHEFRNESYHLITESKQFEESRNVFALESPGEEMLLGYMEKGLFYFDGYSFSKFNTEADSYLIENQMYDATFINDSTLAIGTLSGGLVFIGLDGNIKYIYNSNTGFDEQGVLATYVDHERTLWLGLWGGIEKIQTNIPIFKYSENEGIDFEISDFFFVGGEIYLRSINQLKKSGLLSPEKSLIFQEIFQELSIIASTDITTSNGQIFISGVEGVSTINEEGEEEWVYKGEVLELVENEDTPYTLTFLTKKGLVFREKDEFIIKPFVIPSSRIRKGIYKDKSLFFIADQESVYKLKEDSLSKIKIQNNTGLKTVFNDLSAIGNHIFVGAEGAEENGGLYLYNEKENKFVKAPEFGSDHEALLTKQVLAFDQCGNGNIWMYNDKQIKRIKKVEEEWTVQTSPYQLIGEGDGIFSIKCKEDGVWFGGVNGLYHLTDPDWEYKTDFKTNITDIFVNRDSLIYGGFGEPVKPIVLPYKDNEVRFNYAAASYIDETRNTYSYKLEGFDNEWSEWSLETQKDYTNIPEGDYIFKVRSRNVFEVDGRPDQIAFTVLPPWYRTWWAYMLYLISFSGLLYTGYKIRINQLLKVERMRTKIASDLHDEVSATLTGISYFAEAIKRDKNQSKAAHFVSLISESAGDAKEKITDIVWSINPENDSWELFLSKCRRFTSDLLESKELEYSLNITEHVPGKLNMEVRQHLWMIFKEMITNAVRHSAATRLDVIMDIENGKLKLIVQDNGKGFDLDETVDGNGIRNIRKRSAKIGAVITIHSEEDFGTRWRMELPL
ncbi:MAG: hypothetical protein JJ971_11915 [Balneolaceae bacterium]|nr:hypothetical protein [Balneolaceae bacterium]MBO6547443.1 hypothetical protein [Balneolaceae bacterium]MBO6647610.1 hypothetical protein [Balneolaceae bacterium]